MEMFTYGDSPTSINQLVSLKLVSHVGETLSTQTKTYQKLWRGHTYLITLHFFCICCILTYWVCLRECVVLCLSWSCCGTVISSKGLLKDLSIYLSYNNEQNALFFVWLFSAFWGEKSKGELFHCRPIVVPSRLVCVRTARCGRWSEVCVWSWSALWGVAANVWQ